MSNEVNRSTKNVWQHEDIPFDWWADLHWLCDNLRTDRKYRQPTIEKHTKNIHIYT